MKLHVTMGAALLGLVAVATAAGAAPLLGGSVTRSSASIHNSASSALGDMRHDHFKKPFDTDDGGGPSDPTPKKTPTTTGKGSGGGTGGYYNPSRHYGYPHNPQHYGYYGQPLGCQHHTGPC